MLRLLYLRLLQLHPACFRERFGHEMMSIFDHTEGGIARARLVADGLVSLTRQWMLRPHYARVRTAALSEGGLGFHVFHNSKPRTIALLEGAILTAITFTFVCLTMGYNWRHPILIPIKPPHWGVPNAARGPLYYPPIAEPLPTQSVTSAPTAEDSSKTSLPAVTGAKASPSRIAVPLAPIPLDTLRSYVGNYALELPAGGSVLITLADGILSLQMPRHSPIALMATSATTFSAFGDSDLWIAFEKPAGKQLHIHQDGRLFTATRRSK